MLSSARLRDYIMFGFDMENFEDTRQKKISQSTGTETNRAKNGGKSVAQQRVSAKRGEQ